MSSNILSSSKPNKSIVIPITSDVDLLQLHSLNSSRYPYLLQSIAQPDGRPGYDILFACPQQSLVLDANEKLEIHNAIDDSPAQNLSNYQCEQKDDKFLFEFEKIVESNPVVEN